VPGDTNGTSDVFVADLGSPSPTGSAPSIDPIPTRGLYVGQQLNFTVNASDPDSGDIVTLADGGDLSQGMSCSYPPPAKLASNKTSSFTTGTSVLCSLKREA
jgi:hypothetical protein